MDQRKQRKELSQDIRKKIIDKHVKGKGYKTICKQLDVPVTTVAYIIQKFKIHGTVANLPGRGRRRKIDDESKRRIYERHEHIDTPQCIPPENDHSRSNQLISTTDSIAFYQKGGQPHPKSKKGLSSRAQLDDGERESSKDTWMVAGLENLSVDMHGSLVALTAFLQGRFEQASNNIRGNTVSTDNEDTYKNASAADKDLATLTRSVLTLA
ncbi:hypothetical protein NFI96_005759 [Prochilodus magdalenae]|nr:hypothetical protein NFI96_005759 [Prochilodus magdalenae]